MHFLRGHMYFLLKVMFRNIPWFDETLTNDQILQVSNTMPNDELWEKIAADFQAAVDSLPETQPGEPGKSQPTFSKSLFS